MGHARAPPGDLPARVSAALAPALRGDPDGAAATVAPRQPGGAAVHTAGRAALRAAATGDCGQGGGQSLLCGGVDLGYSGARQPRWPLTGCRTPSKRCWRRAWTASPEAKRLVQIAAVIGPEVPVPLLQSIAELSEEALQRGLAHLQATEFLYETRLFPDSVYTFKHALTHEVAYGSLLQERRRVLHACIVETLEALAGDQVAEQVERLAHHALRGEMWDKALTYCQQAGEKVMARAAHREAVGYLEQALGAAQRLPARHDLLAQGIDLCIILDSAFLTLGDPRRGFDYLRKAIVLAEALDDQRQLGRAANGMTHYFLRTGDFDAAIESGQRALVHATTSGAGVEQAIAHCVLGTAYFSLGDYRSATDVLRRSVAALEGDLGQDALRHY